MATLRLALCLTVLGTLAAACGGDSHHTVVGVIIDLKALNLTEIDTFTLQDTHGEKLLFHVDPKAARDPQEGFAASHLRTHMQAAEKVRITYRAAGGNLVAFKLEHCSAASPPC